MESATVSKQMKISRWICAVAYLLIVGFCAWQSDDAYHGYVMSKHFAEGYGLVYNIGERVNASTCPLYTILIGIAYKITGEMYFTSLAVQIIFSMTAVVLVFWKLCKKQWQVIVSFALFCSASFISYTTSGLENSLLYLLSTIFVLVVFSEDVYSPSKLFVLALLSGLIAMARMDNVLIYLPVLIWVFFIHRRSVPLWKSTLIGFAGVLPFVLWELFSLFYYGFLFPNTAYAKLATGHTLLEYIKKGIEYYLSTAACDLPVVFIPALAVAASFVIKNIRYRLFAAGVFCYMAYLLRIGGDFMVGRHFTVIFLVSICILLQCLDEIKVERMELYRSGIATVCMGCVLFSATVGNLYSKNFLQLGISAGKWGAADERAYYYPHTGLPYNILSLINTGELSVPNTWPFDEINRMREEGVTRGIINWAPGILVYYNSDLYLGDAYALGDPLLARLPAIATVGDNWRVGHTPRAIPQGYAESVKNNTNELVNPNLRQYYDILKLITQGDLFDLNRLKAIVDINLGKYDYLLDTDPTIKHFYDIGIGLSSDGSMDDDGNFITDGTEGFATWGPYTAVPEGTYRFTLHFEVAGNTNQLEQLGVFDVTVDGESLAAAAIMVDEQTATIEVNFDDCEKTGLLEYRVYAANGAQLRLKYIEMDEQAEQQ